MSEAIRILRQHAWQIIRAALQAVDPATAVQRHMRLEDNVLLLYEAPERESHAFDLRQFDRIIVVGGGKAAAPMARMTAAILGRRLACGLVIVKRGYLEQVGGPKAIEFIEAGHPVPDQAGVDAAQRIVELLQQTTARDLVLCLISGGASALMTLPAPGISLEGMQALTRTLLACGATIHEINTIRKHVCQLKGGQLARWAAPAPVISLILSDVVGDALDVIASGPTVPDPTTFADAWSVLERYNIVDKVPQSIVAHIRAGMQGHFPETPKPGDPPFAQVHNVIIGSNRIAARTAAASARQLGYHTLLLTTFLEGEAREVGKVLAGLAKGMLRGETILPSDFPLQLPACLILGGETTVTLRGNGCGGRNQEMALAAALALDGWPGVLVTCLATDGNDGPTDAAGAFADGSTIRRAAALGLDATDYLARNDAYTFFASLGDLVITGPTHTNVNDLAIVLVGNP